ncbi:glycoside hydrolase family 43 protein [Paragemmobacter straminiformis]|uniref:Glycoside hydrolase family 43 protein n=1 Tax=Paragemmobacter straminiformis TaxID=2045119 RepID=A0A842ICX1_9RHOB|nr:glycoside hydrolase family 43 protein [Gemmobacter straminiformis]MBC2837376.1 glycoside hydrolase family 43 protein [Gemmobacter straminiformis]
MIENPVLRGFNPDPSICRVGRDYYIATSTFEWYPGVQIHHSTDLVNWRLVARPLRRASQLDMRGNPDSCGVWAPCLSYADGRFWLVYTDVKRFDGAFKDAHNYIVTCEAVTGEWSDPVYVNSSGFDPSLFHDGDGRKWFLNMRWNHRGAGTGLNAAHDSFDGIEAQEWVEGVGLVGEVATIFTGTGRGLTEAPHLFRRGGWYYLTTAEGGTGYDHAVTMARSRAVLGPYELHPQGHLMTVADPAHGLQRVGHGQYVETPEGEGFHTFLCGRPLGGGFCPLGREMGLARVEWRADGWLYLAGGGMAPPVTVAAGAERLPDAPVLRRFATELPPEFQWLRTPYPGRLFTLTGSALRLTGRESLGSWFEQALVARRQEHHSYRAGTEVICEAPNWQRAAGLVTYYNRHKFHAALVSHEPDIGRCLVLVSCLGDWPGEALSFHAKVPLGAGAVRIGVSVEGAVQRFSVAAGAGAMQAVGPELDARIISDEGGRGEHASFTGAFVGMLAYDLTGQGWSADFTRFDYIPA